MNRCAGAMLALLVSSTAHAAMKEELKGYKDFTFGMDLKQVANSPGGECHTYRNYRVCDAPGPELLKLRTDIKLWFFEDKLVTVDIGFRFPKDMSPSDRFGKYFELSTALTLKYGFPDKANEKGGKVDDVTLGREMFTRYWYGPGQKTSIHTQMSADRDHEIYLIATYDDTVGSQRAIEADIAEQQGIKADLEKL